MSVLQIIAFIWAASAVLALEAWGETWNHRYSRTLSQEELRTQRRQIGLALLPIFNTIVACCYVRDKLKGK